MFLLVAATVTALLSMPGLGGGDDEGIDVPDTNAAWKATVTDETLTDTELQDVSWDGHTHVQGNLGAGTIAIRFEEIDEITFEPAEKNKSVALVHLKSGKTKKITVDGRVNVYGRTDFGNYKILVKDLRKLDLRGAPVPRPSPTPKADGPKVGDGKGETVADKPTAKADP